MEITSPGAQVELVPKPKKTNIWFCIIWSKSSGQSAEQKVNQHNWWMICCYTKDNSIG